MAVPSQSYHRIDKDKIRRLRLNYKRNESAPLGITLSQLASELGVSHDAIHTLETKKNHVPSSELIIRYCNFFKVPFIELLVREERIRMVKIMADFFLQHEIIDYGTAQTMINFHMRDK